jgi:hypothetical protein
MQGDDLLKTPGEPLDDRDDTDPRWTVDDQLSHAGTDYSPDDPADV